MKKLLDISSLIIYEDENYLVVNKPPFISTLEDRNDTQNMLLSLRQRYPEAQTAHRLDKNTSGALLVALNPEAYRHASMQFENRTIKKTYHAVCDGIHRFREHLVALPILKQTDGRAKIDRTGKPAETFFNTEQAYQNHTLVACQPITGRMHQIRLHLQSLHAPITGDDMYGGTPFLLSLVKKKYNLKKQTEEQPLMKRMALHAYRLEFCNLNQEKILVEVPYPKDFRALLKQLSAHTR